jgi:uncharacterized integral membrane protein (TIGR00698 family)
MVLNHTRGVVGGVLPGIVLSVLLAVLAAWIAGGLGEPLTRNPVLVAMLFGLLIGNAFGCPDIFKPGLDFTKRYLLRLAVMLVGFRITVRLLSELGAVPIAVGAIELLVVLVGVRWLALRVFKLDRDLALLLAAGSAVCGAAAILCVAALIRSKEQHAGIAIALITLAGTLALLVYPVAFSAGMLPGLDDRLYGIFVGASIYELAQVYGASFAISEGALNTATLVKLSKVLMLVPLLLVLGVMRRRAAGADRETRLPIPWFVFGFIGVMLLNSAFTINPQLRRLVLEFDQFLFLMVMVALGLTTRLGKLAEGGVGWRLGGVGIVALVLSSVTAYALVAPLGQHSESNVSAPAESTMLSNPGGRVFSSVGCAKCHVPSLSNGQSQVTLYSDLLLHDMGPALDDKIVQGTATGADWRTTPLLGLSQRYRYLHDGRATSLHDAILAHGGEGEIVRDRFLELDESKQRLVYQFLDTL